VEIPPSGWPLPGLSQKLKVQTALGHLRDCFRGTRTDFRGTPDLLDDGPMQFIEREIWIGGVRLALDDERRPNGARAPAQILPGRRPFEP
jgi:hypothetical protein